MSDHQHRVDKYEVLNRENEKAVEKIAVIESNAGGSNVAFLKSNYNFKKVRDRLSEPNFGMVMGALLTKLCGLSGVKESISDFDKQDISNLITRRYDGFTPEEIWKAFELERHGDYPERSEHYGLFNAEYFSKVMDKYKTWRTQTRMQFNITRETSNALPEMSESGKKELMDNAINRSFKEFKENGEISLPCIHIFDELWERKMFPQDTPYDACFKLATRDVESEYKKESIVTGSVHSLNEVTKEIENKNSGKVLARAKMLTLEWYFKKLIDKGYDCLIT